MWQKMVKPYVDSGRLVVIGVVQEQHADRAKLYRQWRELDWPIFVDSLNLLDVEVVPLPVAIDASGIVRHESIRPNQFARLFMDVAYPATPLPANYRRAARGAGIEMIGRPAIQNDPRLWRDAGDAFFLYGASTGLDMAIGAYQRAAADPKDGRARFRLGVSLRRRYEWATRHPGDGQAAVEQWGAALAINPNQYIWRRRIQQYGPRLDKPYNFYFWVSNARAEITARGATPVALAVEPSGSELAPPERRKVVATPAESIDRDPDGRINRDKQGFVEIDPVVTPASVRPGRRVRVRVEFRLDTKRRPYWNNEADELSVWVGLTRGLTFGEGVLTHPNPADPETREVRLVEFEVAIDSDAPAGPIELPAYALYYVCGDKGGKCFYLRQDFKVTINVDPNAPRMR